MPDIFVNNNFYQGTSQACIVDLTPPTFGGVNFLDVESRGQIRAGWSAASDATTPIRYEIYIQASTSIGLFNTVNIISVTNKLQYDIFTLPDGSFLVNGTTYYVGVRAIDGVNNRDSNTVSMSVISTGVLTTIDVYQTRAVFSINTSNQFQLTAWADKNQSLANTPDAVLGVASYQVYDKAGNAVVGMSGSGVSPNGQGLYIFPAVSSTLTEFNRHYEIKVTISVDGENRTNFIPINDSVPDFRIDGVSSLSNTNDLIGSFWVIKDGNILTSGLGLGSYQAYDASGNLILGLSENNISPDVNGMYSITPFALPPSINTTQSYSVRVSAIVDGVLRSDTIVIDASPTTYTCRVTFSINSSNQLEATFWATVNDELADPTILGTASYQIYDKAGNAVVGLTQTGITPDVQGLFHTTPVSASLLTDLTHYTAKITIEVAGQDRTVMKGFTLLGT
jgi:hypothetical protein